MKRTKIQIQLQDYPAELEPLLRDASVYDSSCSPEARVLYIERDGGYFLKSAPAGTLSREAAMTRYFHQKGLGTAVLYEHSDATHDWLLTARVAGEDLTHARYLEQPERLCDCLAERLRMLHDTTFADCPVQNHTVQYLARAEENYRKGEYDVSYFCDLWGIATAEEIYALLQRDGHLLCNDTLLHGDYCLPNVIYDGWRFSGFIDLGNGGVGDRHVDLFWGAWTLNFNLHTDRYRNRFLDAYGRDRVEEELLRVVAAAEVFG